MYGRQYETVVLKLKSFWAHTFPVGRFQMVVQGGMKPDGARKGELAGSEETQIGVQGE